MRGGDCKFIPNLRLLANMLKMEDVSNSIKQGTQSIMIGNFVMNIILSGSLQFLWGMINTLQLIVHFPLFRLKFPANAQFMYQIIIDIANFQLIPEDTQ